LLCGAKKCAYFDILNLQKFLPEEVTDYGRQRLFLGGFDLFIHMKVTLIQTIRDF